jgi:hypothetical protein
MKYTDNTRIKVVLIQEEALIDVAEGSEPERYEDEKEFAWGELVAKRHPLLRYILGDLYTEDY